MRLLRVLYFLRLLNNVDFLLFPDSSAFLVPAPRFWNATFNNTTASCPYQYKERNAKKKEKRKSREDDEKNDFLIGVILLRFAANHSQANPYYYDTPFTWAYPSHICFYNFRAEVSLVGASCNISGVLSACKSKKRRENNFKIIFLKI